MGVCDPVVGAKKCAVPSAVRQAETIAMRSDAMLPFTSQPNYKVSNLIGRRIPKLNSTYKMAR